ncbi:MAG: hypothetical protein K6E59_06240 [Bacilli bacterium]|nr:hypothetical protein [Bacilli bacterium]
MILSEEAKKLYAETFGKEKTRVFYSHGRLELLGNHTDHQGGVCLVAGVDLGITAAVAKNDDGAIRVASEGYAPFMFHLDELRLKKGEVGTTIAIFKGVLSRMKALGHKIGGFSAALKSDLPSGSGLSSSAAVEALVVHILDTLYGKGDMKPMEMAKISQYAENRFFGKPCGLLDQIGVCYGGLNYLNFANPDDIVVEPLEYTLTLKLVLVNTGGTHANLTHLYAAIPNDMTSVARNLLGVERLCESNLREFLSRVSVPCLAVSETAKLRAQHYFDECNRVEEAKKALREKDSFTFIQDVRMSQESSRSLLCNTYVPGQYEHSPQQGVDVANRIIGHGGVRIMGGGFAGSILCFVYPEDEKEFILNMAKYYGKENVVPLKIVEGGPTEIK